MRFEKGMRGVNLEKPKVDIDIVLLKERIEVELDEEFDPLFTKLKPLLPHLEEQLLIELPPALSMLANYPLNSQFGGSLLIKTTVYACQQIWQMLQEHHPYPNTLKQLHLPREVTDDCLIKDVSLMGIPNTYLMIYEPREIQPNEDPVVYATFDTNYQADNPTNLPFVDSPGEEDVDSHDEFKSKILQSAIIEYNQHYVMVGEGDQACWEDKPLIRPGYLEKIPFSYHKGQPRWRREAMWDLVSYTRIILNKSVHEGMEQMHKLFRSMNN